MYDTGKVIAGIVVFLILATSPLVYNAMTAEGPEPPTFEPPPNGSTDCVMPTEWMRANHMDLLDTWRDDVVRRGVREFTVEKTGEKVPMSLTLTCVNCHSNKSQFCDACHTYMAVSPYCWDCHVAPVEEEEAS